MEIEATNRSLDNSDWTLGKKVTSLALNQVTQD